MLISQKTDRLEILNIFTVLVLLLSVHLIYHYYSTTNISVRVDNPKFSLLGPYNSSQPELQDVYNQLIDIKNFSFLVNPQPCQGYDEGLLLVVIVSSNPSNFNKRAVIRSTWGRAGDATKLVFLLGETDASTAQLLANESAAHRDIVQGTFTDAYRNMTYKHVMGLKWVSHHCPTARYILKTDDDVLVNMHALRQFLARELSPWGARELIVCEVIRNSPVQRSSKSKWKVTSEEYTGKYYPTYCAGWSILYSQDVVARLLSTAQSTPYFWIDDVHITGVIAEKIGVSRTPLSNLILSKRRADILTSYGAQYSGPFLFGPPELTTDRISQIWHAIPK